NNGTITASVAPGQYTSTETVPAGWALTSISCDDANSTGNVGTATATFNAEAGETVTCTFTNTKGAAVIVKKVMVGGTGTFTYSGTPSGAISTNNGTITASVAPGQYTSTETVPARWALTSISCDDANSTGNVGTATASSNAEAGETVTCTFTNTGVTSAGPSVTNSAGVTTTTTVATSPPPEPGPQDPIITTVSCNPPTVQVNQPTTCAATVSQVVVGTPITTPTGIARFFADSSTTAFATCTLRATATTGVAN